MFVERLMVACLRRRELAFVLLTLLMVPVQADAAPEVPKSVFWEPYANDVQTAGLFHFDGQQPVSIDKLLAAPGKEDPLGGLLKESAPAAGGPGVRTAANAAPMGRALALRGACAEAAGAGRFGGGLRFGGQDGMAIGELPTGPRSIEFWIRPESLPTEAATVLAVRRAPNRPPVIALRVRRDGVLEVEWAGLTQTAASGVLKPQRWTHLALAWDGRQRAEFRADGQAVSLPEPLPAAKAEDAVEFALGNNFDGKSGLHGVADELRVSRTVREYYPWKLGWTDVAGALRRPEGQPLFRDPQDLVLRLAFNRTLKPAQSSAKVSFTELGPEQLGDEVEPNRWKKFFGDGVEGQALLLKPDGLEATLEGKGLALPDRGTLAFWIRPLNWNDEVRWNPFAGWPLKQVPLLRLFQGGNRAKPVMALSLIQTPNNEALHPIGFHPGRWVHLACAWDGKKETWFVDGRPWPHWGSLAWQRGNWDESKRLTLVFDRDASACAIDDFRIYRRPLAPAEIANLARLFDTRQEPQPLPPFEMTLTYNGVLGYVDVGLVALHPDYAKAATARVTVTAKGAAAPLASQDIDLAKEAAPRGRIETGPMDFGDYEVKAEARDAAGKPLFAASDSFTRRPPPWWKNTIGRSDKVMPGWTPVRAKEKTLSVILRDIRFSDAGLPESVISAGAEVLAGPVALAAAVGEREVRLAPVPNAFRAETRGEVRADFSGRVAGAGIVADVKGYLEFDGMMWFELTLRPEKQPSKIDALSLRIPYNEDCSRLVHWWSGAHGFRNPRVVHIGATPAGEGAVFSSLDKQRVQLHGSMRGSFIPYVMFTGDRRGMAWFAENDRGWTQSTTTPAVSIERQGRTVTLALNLIAEPVTIAGPRTIEFGLHPIPVKELEPGWRMTPNWGVFPDSFCGFNLKGPTATQFYRHPLNMDWDMAKRLYKEKDAQRWEDGFIAGFRRRYKRDPKPRENSVTGLYHALAYMAADFPDHTREWGEAFGSQRYTPEMIDYCAWIWDLWVEHGLAKGIYFDECWNYPVDAFPSPVTYKLPDGKVQPGFQFRQFREHMKRVRQVFHDHGLVPHLCAHTTHTYFIPYHTFFDTILDGEDFYQGAGDKRDFMDSWVPDRLRFMNPEKWGLISTWLGWHAGGDKNWSRFPTLYWQHWRAYTAALLVHDIVWTVGMGGHHEVDEDWLRASKLCLDPDTAFVGYWDPAAVARHGHGDLYASAWKRPGWCAVALANWGKDRLEAELRLDLKAMGFGDVPPAQVQIRDVDTKLLKYFDNDASRIKSTEAPQGPNPPGTSDLVEELLRPAEKPAPDERRAADPDGAFHWAGGVLRCPVRRHDFRLFEFRTPGSTP